MANEPQDNSPSRAKNVLVVGAKGGVGTSTAALALAQELSTRGRRVIAVDANLGQDDLGLLTGADRGDRPGVGELLHANPHPPGAAQKLSQGFELIHGVRSVAGQALADRDGADRLIGRLSGVALASGLTVADGRLVIDAGRAPSAWALELARHADQVALVTAPDRLSVINAYAALKQLRKHAPHAAIGLVWNHCQNQQAAEHQHSRVSRPAQTFMGETLSLAGWMPTVAEEVTPPLASLADWVLAGAEAVEGAA